MFARLRNFYLAAALAAAGTFFSQSAVAVGPPNAIVYEFPGKAQTYRATILGLVPAASATDFFTITGSATTQVAVREMGCTGTSTAAGSLAVQLMKRSAVNTTGTSTNPTAVPMSSANAAATAVVAAYTANPGGLGTAVGPIASGLLGTVPPASAGGGGLYFRWSPNDIQQAPTLIGATQVLAMNANAASFTAGASLNCFVVWTESPIAQ